MASALLKRLRFEEINMPLDRTGGFLARPESPGHAEAVGGDGGLEQMALLNQRKREPFWAYVCVYLGLCVGIFVCVLP